MRSLAVGGVLSLHLLASPRCVALAVPSKHPLPVPPARAAGSTPMSWRSHGHDNDSLVDALVRNKVIRSPGVAEALRRVDRGRYVLAEFKGDAYTDSPIPIGYGQTISAPHMHAMCAELLEDHLWAGASVLDVGSGSGYLAAVFCQLVGPEGRVTGVELVPELVERSRETLRQDPATRRMVESGRLSVHQADAHYGCHANAPYDVIHVGAAAEGVPQALEAQLKPGGRMVIPIGRQHHAQQLVQVDKGPHGELSTRVLMGVQYVPLVDTGQGATDV